MSATEDFVQMAAECRVLLWRASDVSTTQYDRRILASDAVRIARLLSVHPWYLKIAPPHRVVIDAHCMTVDTLLRNIPHYNSLDIPVLQVAAELMAAIMRLSQAHTPVTSHDDQPMPTHDW